MSQAGTQHEHANLASEFHEFRVQYAEDQAKNREILNKLHDAIFGDGTAANLGIREENRRNTDFRRKWETETKLMRKLWVGLIGLAGALATWWGALHKK